MTDYGHEETDRRLKKLERKIHAEYEQASKEVQTKLDDYLRRFQIKDNIKREAVAAGEITQEEYTKWRTGQIMIGKRWEEMRDTLAQDLTNTDKIAMSMVKGYMPDVYALNHNYGTFEAEKGSMIDTSYTLYDRQTVENLMKKNPDLLPKPSVDIPKDLQWNKRHIVSAITQGILQGEDIRKISKRLQGVTDMDRRAAIRNARTMTTSAENAGRSDSYVRAKEMGIEMEQVWLATLDERTRDSHRELDGEAIKVGDKWHHPKFSNGLRYPGDPDGPPAEVYNCRCTLIAQVTGINLNPSDISKRNNYKLGGMSYEEWKNEHTKKQKPVIKPLEPAQAIKHPLAELSNYNFEEKESIFNELQQAKNDVNRSGVDISIGRYREQKIKEVNQRYSKYNGIIGATDEDIKRLKEENEELRKQYKFWSDESDKWYDRPDRKLFPDEYAEWKEWKRSYQDRGIDPGEKTMELSMKISDNSFIIDYYPRYKEDLKNAQQYPTLSELKRKQEKAQAKADDLQSKFSPMDSKLMAAHNNKKIEYNPVTVLDHKLEETDIIEKLAGGDKTEGSCASLALAYMGNKAGFNVTDYRGGESRSFIATGTTRQFAHFPGVISKTETGEKEQECAIKLLHTMEQGKEYMLVTGRHAAIVRHHGDKYQYLEMQSSYDNGWHDLGNDSNNDDYIAEMLKWRFACCKKSKYESESVLVDVDSASKVANFDTLLGFLNTETDKQMKGKGGVIK